VLLSVVSRRCGMRESTRFSSGSQELAAPTPVRWGPDLTFGHAPTPVITLAFGLGVALSYAARGKRSLHRGIGCLVLQGLQHLNMPQSVMRSITCSSSRSAPTADRPVCRPRRPQANLTAISHHFPRSTNCWTLHPRQERKPSASQSAIAPRSFYAAVAEASGTATLETPSAPAPASRWQWWTARWRRRRGRAPPRCGQVAFPRTAPVLPLETAKMLRATPTSFSNNVEDLAMIDRRPPDCGQPYAENVRELQVGAVVTRFLRGPLQRDEGPLPSSRGTGRGNFSVREPFGVSTHHSVQPPFFSVAERRGGPLAAGNTIVVKPPSQAPLSSSLRLAELIAAS